MIKITKAKHIAFIWNYFEGFLKLQGFLEDGVFDCAGVQFIPLSNTAAFSSPTRVVLRTFSDPKYPEYQ